MFGGPKLTRCPLWIQGGAETAYPRLWMLISGKRGNTLVIPDLHLPYQHPNAFDFLQSLHDYYCFQRVLCVGDIFDHHRPSYHESELDALNAEDEFERAMEDAQRLQEMFPTMHITLGNHDDLPVRQAKTVGIPLQMLSDINRIYGLSKGWVWLDQYWFDSWGSYPIVVPMVLNRRGAWDKAICEI